MATKPKGPPDLDGLADREAPQRLSDDALLAALDQGVASGRAAPGVFERVRAGGARKKQ